MITFRQLQEKAVSKQQQKLMGLALSYKRGDTPDAEVSDTVRDLAKSMSTKELEKYAGTKHKGLPQKVDEAVAIDGRTKTFKETMKRLQNRKMKLAEKEAKKPYLEMGTNEIVNKYSEMTPGQTNEAFKSSYDQAAGLAVAGAALAGRRKVGQAVSKVGKAVTGTAKKIAKFGASKPKPKPSAPSSAPAPTTPAKKSPSEDPRNVRRREKRAADKKAKADAAARKMKKAQDLVARQRARTRAAMGAKRGKV